MSEVKPTDIRDPEYFHKVVDCQYACPAHTPVPEYIRLIAQERYDDAYMVNWESNVFPGILGRTCDRPCEPACRRGRVEEEPVAICRLKRVAADNKDSIIDRLPKIPKRKNGKKVALIGGGPASLTVARDLAPLGYQLDLYDDQPAGGGFMRSQIPSFRLPPTVLDEEVDYILDMGIHTHFETYVDSLKGVWIRVMTRCLSVPARPAAASAMTCGMAVRPMVLGYVVVASCLSALLGYDIGIIGDGEITLEEFAATG